MVRRAKLSITNEKGVVAENGSWMWVGGNMGNPVVSYGLVAPVMPYQDEWR